MHVTFSQFISASTFPTLNTLEYSLVIHPYSHGTECPVYASHNLRANQYLKWLCAQLTTVIYVRIVLRKCPAKCIHAHKPESEPSSLPHACWWAKWQSHGCPVVLVDPHTLSPESSWYCASGAGQLLKVLINCVCIHAFIIVSVHTMSCFPP